MKIILRRSLTGVAESPWNGWPDVHGISGRIAVDWVAECAWNQWPNDRGIRTLVKSLICLRPFRLQFLFGSNLLYVTQKSGIVVRGRAAYSASSVFLLLCRLSGSMLTQLAT